MKYSMGRVLFLTILVSLYAAKAEAACTAPDGVHGEQVFNADTCVMQYCDGTNWTAMGPIPSSCVSPDPCAAAGPGDEGMACMDGSVYAGNHPVGGQRIYVTPADNGANQRWNNNSGTWTVTGATDANDGAANTTTLDGLADAASPHAAAKLCAALTDLGHTDWYLPALNELAVLQANAVAIDGFNMGGGFPSGWYWSSTETDSQNAKAIKFSDGTAADFTKNSPSSIRCVRKN